MTKSLFSIGISRDSSDKVRMEIGDSISGDNVLSLEFTLEEYAKAVTGSFGQSIEGRINTEAVIGSKREVQSIVVPSDYGSFGGDKSAMVQFHFEQNYEPHGWVLHCDGTKTRQDNRDGHVYTIRRYKSVDDISDFKKDY